MNMILKRTISTLTAAVTLFSTTNIFAAETYNWYDTYIRFCSQRGIISGNENGDLMPNENLTREQMAKMIINALSVNMTYLGTAEYNDIAPDRWSYPYICKYQEYEINHSSNFYPTQQVTREEFMAMAIKMSSMGNINPSHIEAMKSAFRDWEEIDEKYLKFIAVGFEMNCITGSDGYLKPKDKLTRAEACAILYKVIYAQQNAKLSYYYHESANEALKTTGQEASQNNNSNVSQQPAYTTSTPLVGESVATLEQAKQWAKNKGAAQRYIDIADLYWKYGELTGLRADILYAQAAKETNFGKYTGQVKPEQNNWAGIKKYGATGDEPEDHEDFATPEDGVRGHFNHMCAYVGLNPIGEPHGRYKSVKSLSWAGTVKTAEQLGGKWCPNTGYGVSIVNDYLKPMTETKVN